MKLVGDGGRIGHTFRWTLGLRGSHRSGVGMDLQQGSLVRSASSGPTSYRGSEGEPHYSWVGATVPTTLNLTSSVRLGLTMTIA